MLTKFSVKNFRGFKDEIVWDLTNHQDYDFNESAICDGVIKNGIIYGPNGAGKSNFTLALMDIAYNFSIDKRTKISNFVCVYAPNDLIHFSYEFLFGEDKVIYQYSKNSACELISESFNVNGKEIFRQDPEVVDIPGVQGRALEDFLKRTNKVSIVNYLFNVFPLDDNDPIVKLKNFVDKMLWYSNSENSFTGGPKIDITPEKNIVDNNHTIQFSAFLDEISNQRFDLVPLKTILKNKVGEYNPIMWKANKQLIPFASVRSTGTTALEKLYSWIMKLEEYSFIVFDEFDAFYHFELAYKVCQYLFSHSESKQIFLTTHNTYLMTNDLLRPDCNFLIDNNMIKPLCDCTAKDLSFASNVERLYRANSFKI